MTTTFFRQIGPYEILQRIGHGGIASVFLAKDTRSDGSPVALKVVPDGPDTNARETAEAERRGAELQRAYLDKSLFVPRVYDVGLAAGYLYIAMEYLDGSDLSAIIQTGPLDPRRAASIAIQLCLFLEEVDRLQTTASTSSLTLLHNDLKPSNIRIVAGDCVKVLDFGAAKTLSMSRRATRNDFYSTPYLSPECLDTGDRDRQTDTWALGVILYEMIAGVRPFDADDTRRLEDRIRSRRPPEALTGCPIAIQAIVAKMLAPAPEGRYPEPAAIRDDLERFMTDRPTIAEREGWPGKAADEPPTRRPQRVPAPDRPDRDDEPPTRHTPRVITPPETGATTRMTEAALPVVAARSGRWKHLGRWLQVAAVVAGLGMAANEGCVARDAGRLAATAPMQEFGGLTNLWTEYTALSSRSLLGGVGARSLASALSRQSLVLAERVADNYRTPTPTVREAQWIAAAAALERALTVSPSDPVLRGTLRYCQGHLLRINGEAHKARREMPQAQRDFADAVTAFREAAALRQRWPDPFLGLARTFIYGIEDIDRGADAMNEAQQLGHPIGDRETAQLADGYRLRGDTLERAAADLRGLAQEREFLLRARDAYKQSLDLYTKIAGYADAPTNIRMTQRHLTAVERRLTEIDVTAGSTRTSHGRDLHLQP